MRIQLNEGLKIAKAMVSQMVTPTVTETEWGYVITDGHYTVAAELFGYSFLKEKGLLGETVVEVDGVGTVEMYDEFLNLHKTVKDNVINLS